MPKKSKTTTVPITKISIENVSKWPTMYATLKVNGLLQDEDDRDYILSHRDVGCTFQHKDGVNIGVLPVSKAYPADTLFFYLHDSKEGNK